MYDAFDDCFDPAERDYHEEMLLQEAEEFDRDFYGDEPEADEELEKLLDDLEPPFILAFILAALSRLLAST